KISGRLSLNPLIHIDPIGSILVPTLLYLSQSGFLFGWAKPVPVNPFKLRGGAAAFRWVSLAGVLTNFLLAIAAAIIIKAASLFLGSMSNNLGIIFFTSILQINLVLAIFNLLPLPGFDGFNFLSTFPILGNLIKKTPLGNPLFMANYGLIISIFILFIFMPYISWFISWVFALFVRFFAI
ncbi:MAG: site-2 protease family protein, partial [Candidatus Buchananbacteria bacterium]